MIFKNHHFKREFLSSYQNWAESTENSRISSGPLPCQTLPHFQHLTLQWCTCYTWLTPSRHHNQTKAVIYIHSWCAYSVDFNKCIMTCIHHCSTIWNNFTALKLLCALPIHPPPHTPTSWQLLIFLLTPCCYCSIGQLWLTLCDPMDYSTPGFPVLHHLLEFAQTHVHWVDMPSYQLILCRPLLLLLSIFPSIRVFSNESALCIMWPKYWIFSFSISPSNEFSGLISFRIDWFDVFAVQGTCKSLLQHHSSKHQFWTEFYEKSYCLPKWPYHFESPTAINESSSCFKSSWAFDVIGALDFGYYNRCVVVSHCCFNLYFPMTYDQRRQWHPTPVLLPGKSHGRRSLVGCSPWGC